MTIETLIAELLEIKKKKGQDAVWDYIDQLAIEADRLKRDEESLFWEKLLNQDK
jgi:hypothetical protein